LIRCSAFPNGGTYLAHYGGSVEKVSTREKQGAMNRMAKVPKATTVPFTRPAPY